MTSVAHARKFIELAAIGDGCGVARGELSTPPVRESLDARIGDDHNTRVVRDRFDEVEIRGDVEHVGHHRHVCSYAIERFPDVELYAVQRGVHGSRGARRPSARTGRYWLYARNVAMIVLIGLTSWVSAAEPAGCRTMAHRAFDFWLGAWLVRLPDGTPGGTNRIVDEQGGCVLLERWLGASGSTGMSVNYLDPVTARWHQLWVSTDSLIRLEGEVVDGSMTMEGTITYLSPVETLPFRGAWTPLVDGRVRQRFDEQRGGEWQPWFEGYYERVVERGTPSG